MAQYGEILVGGQRYIERSQTFPSVVSVTVGLSVQTQLRVTLPGVAPFLLKSLARDTIVNGASSARRFRFRLGNSDGGNWYQAGGVGGTTDRVIDTNIFGTAQFPYVLTPYVFYNASSSILFEIEDLSNSAPYTIEIAWGGSYLIQA